MSENGSLPYIPGTVFSLQARNLSTLFTDTAGTTPVTAQGDIVRRFGDSSINSSGTANNCHFTGTNGPSYHPTAFNGGYPCVRFDGINDVLTAANNFPAAANTAFTITIAFQTAATGNLFIYGVNSTTSVFTFFWRYSGSGSPPGWYEFDTKAGNGVFTKNVPTSNSPTIMMIEYDGGTTLWMTVIDSTGRKYSTAAVGFACDNPITGGSVGISGLPMILGAYPNGPNYWSQIDVAAFHAVSRRVSSDEKARILAEMCEMTGICTLPSVILIGDSMTSSANLSGADTFYAKVRAALSGIATVSCTAVPGRQMYHANQDWDQDPGPLLFPRSSLRTIVHMCFGANDVYYLGAAEAAAQVWEMCDLVAYRGGIPIPGTILNRGDQVIEWKEFNALLRADLRYHAPMLIDYAADPILGADDYPTNATVCQAADNIHLTAAGTTIKSGIAVPALTRAVRGVYDQQFLNIRSRSLSTGSFLRS